MVMVVIGGIGFGVAVASYLYVKSKYLRFTDTRYSGVKMITSSISQTDPLEVNQHYVVIPGGTNELDISLKLGTNYPVNTYLSFYQPFPLCGQANAAVNIPTGPFTQINLNPSEAVTVYSYRLWNNYGALFIVVNDLGTNKWKLMRIWALDVNGTGQTSLQDTQSYTADGSNARNPKTS